MSALEDILAFWFAEGRAAQWFQRSDTFDAEVRQVLLPHHKAALEGHYQSWRREPRGCLALCLLLDQVPRNVYRGTPRAFACDAQARDLTRHALDQGFDAALGEVERLFLYLPLEHSEDLRDQEDCLRLVAALESNPEWLRYAKLHRDIIARFGRFPHRNAVLGRESTEAERAFLELPDSAF